ncbi:dynactin 3 (p22) [Columba livia]|uniref:Dynactin 3 (p22) n=1 Tax=Columba livia TaxID=8932 RepID=A0A2I0LHM4_COLLI|nr:dynactin subunit 3 [Columba livia]PKK16938.1 dynactin 3 (p22) [Columba livia]
MPPSAVQITIDRPQRPFFASAGGSAPPAPLPGSRLPASHPPGSLAPARSVSMATAPPSNVPPWQRGGESRKWRDGAGKVADELVKVQVALSNIAGKKERIKILFKKIEDVIKYLDPQYIDRMAVPDAMKLQFILAEEQVIPSRAALLEQVKNLQPILDSTSIQAVPDHAAKLQRLSQIHIQQQEQRQDLTNGVKKLLEDYNKMTLLLSKQFIQWNEILTQLEAAKEAKPAAE